MRFGRRRRRHDSALQRPCLIDRLRAQARDLPFNRYAWLTTHNSFARLGQRSQTGVAIATPWSQQDTVTEQLNVSALCPLSLA